MENCHSHRQVSHLRVKSIHITKVRVISSLLYSKRTSWSQTKRFSPAMKIQSKKSVRWALPNPSLRSWPPQSRVDSQTSLKMKMKISSLLPQTPCSASNHRAMNSSSKIRSSSKRRWRRMRRPSMTLTTPTSSTTSRRKMRRRMSLRDSPALLSLKMRTIRGGAKRTPRR